MSTRLRAKEPIHVTAREPRLRRLLKPFVIVTVVALSGLAANVLHDAIQPLAHRPGLAQRLGFAGYFLWFVYVAWRTREEPQDGVATLT